MRSNTITKGPGLFKGGGAAKCSNYGRRGATTTTQQPRLSGLLLSRRIRNIVICIALVNIAVVFLSVHSEYGPLHEDVDAVHQQQHPFAKQLSNNQQRVDEKQEEQQRRKLNASEGNEIPKQQQEQGKKQQQQQQQQQTGEDQKFGKAQKERQQEVQASNNDNNNNSEKKQEVKVESKQQHGQEHNKIHVIGGDNHEHRMEHHHHLHDVKELEALNRRKVREEELQKARHDIEAKRQQQHVDTSNHHPVRLPQRKQKNPQLEEPRPRTVGLDPLMPDNFFINHTDTVRYHRLPHPPKVKWLGVLLDAGRHYFPIDWIKRLLVLLHRMRYNLLHLRLTDDQTFNIQLKSYPHLAHPARTKENPEGRTYTIAEMKDLVQFARSLNITIMPEVNIPGHAGSWAGGTSKNPTQDHVIVPCPNFICEKGYGIPLNVSTYNNDIYVLLKAILKEIIYDIFDKPPLLHLGGDEVHMALPCFRELGINKIPFNYNNFEAKLKQILVELNYDERNVLRWEITGPQLQYINGDGSRAGKILQYWESEPGERKTFLAPDMDRFFVSRHFYFDSNFEVDGHEIFEKSMKYVHHQMRNESWFPLGMIGGAFELSTEYWFDRNVIGRLLAVYLGTTQYGYDVMYNNRAANLTRRSFEDVYGELCLGLGLHKNVCELYGRPAIPTSKYKEKWEQTWQLWKDDVCTRLTHTETPRSFRAEIHVDGNGRNMKQVVSAQANQYFWKSFAKNSRMTTLQQGQQQQEAKNLFLEYGKEQHEQSKSIFEMFFIGGSSSSLNIASRKVGVIFDLTVNNHVSDEYINKMLKTIMEPLGMNAIQLRLLSAHGFVVDIPALGDIEKRHIYRVLADKVPKVNITAKQSSMEEQRHRKLIERRQQQRAQNNNNAANNNNNQPFPKDALYTFAELVKIIQHAKKYGMEVIPEISVSTTAGGWANTGYIMNCPRIFCGNSDLGDTTNHVGGNGLVTSMHDPDFLPLLYTIIRELRRLFSQSSSYFHLGSDERVTGLECYKESLRYAFNKDEDPKFYEFETQLQTLLGIIGIPEDKILRHDNEESTVYETRAGNITQHRSISSKFLDNDYEMRGEKQFQKMLKQEFWAKMDLFRADASEGKTTQYHDLWDIYRHAREWIDPGIPIDGAPHGYETMKPTGIMAEILFLPNKGGGDKGDDEVDEEYFWTTLQIPQRLLAFRMGTLVELPTYKRREDFEPQFMHICQHVLGWKKNYCVVTFRSSKDDDEHPYVTPLFLQDRPELHVESSSYLEKQCRQYTQDLEPRRMIKDHIV